MEDVLYVLSDLLLLSPVSNRVLPLPVAFKLALLHLASAVSVNLPLEVFDFGLDFRMP